jgi:hypothetical protein
MHEDTDPTMTRLVTEGVNVFPLTVNENALAHAMLNGIGDGIIRYTLDARGMRIVQTISDAEWPVLVKKFSADPKTLLGVARQNIFAISKDPQLNQAEKSQRIRRYVRAYLDLQIKLDVQAFENVDTPKQGVPEYVPHGLIDMGSDDRLQRRTGREMLFVDKSKIFQQSFDQLVEFFSTPVEDATSTETKTKMTKRVAAFVYNSMQYDYDRKGPAGRNAGSLVGVHEAQESKLAQCRHHALYAQVLLQACGITSRLLKCDVGFPGKAPEAHGANVVRINGEWFILDTTNPDHDGKQPEVFMAPLPDTHIDPNSSTGKVWTVQRKYKGETWTYKSRNNMYYRIRHGGAH